jgi:hypothetical protein
MGRRFFIAECWALVWSIHCISSVQSFTPTVRTCDIQRRHAGQWATRASSVDSKKEAKEAKVGDLLSYLPTPSFLVELSLMEKFLVDKGLECSVEEFLKDPTSVAGKFEGEDFADCGAFFIHTSVTSTAKRDAVVEQQGSGKSLSVCDVDTPFDSVHPAGAYLGLGLANHHVGGYYWARSMGIGASLPAHGIFFGPSDNHPLHGELYWRKRGPGDPAETTEESSNSNDGKRSEWADFLRIGETVQLVPMDPLSILVGNQTCASGNRFDMLLGLRRAGRPLGADPIVESTWKRSNDNSGNSWSMVP